jgi:hypothetical protein
MAQSGRPEKQRRRWVKMSDIHLHATCDICQSMQTVLKSERKVIDEQKAEIERLRVALRELLINLDNLSVDGTESAIRKAKEALGK